MTNKDFYTSMMRDLGGIAMSERVRSQAEHGIRKSAVIIELLAGVASYVSPRTEQAKARS